MKTQQIVNPTPKEIALVREVYQNFPESSVSLDCIRYEYGNFRFVFVDNEDGKQHSVTEIDAVRGLRLFIAAVDSGKLPGLGLPADYLDDTGSWDADAFDALNQFAIFGEVIYG